MYWTMFLPYPSILIYFSLTLVATGLSVFEVSMFKYFYIEYNAQDWAISSPMGQDHKVSVFSLYEGMKAFNITLFLDKLCFKI